MTDLVHFLLDELVLLAARKLLAAVRVRHLELVALLLGDAKLRFRLSGLGLISLVGLHRRVQLVQHAQYLLVRLVADLATLRQYERYDYNKLHSMPLNFREIARTGRNGRDSASSLETKRLQTIIAGI